jgi:hypothetical protein
MVQWTIFIDNIIYDIINWDEHGIEFDINNEYFKMSADFNIVQRPFTFKYFDMNNKKKFFL